MGWLGWIRYLIKVKLKAVVSPVMEWLILGTV